MANTFHVSVYVKSIPHAVERYRKIDVASEMVRVKATDVPLLEQKGTTCCYAKADKFWVRDADDIPWEMYTLLENVEAETAADTQLRRFLGQERETTAAVAESACGVDCCVRAPAADAR